MLHSILLFGLFTTYFAYNPKNEWISYRSIIIADTEKPDFSIKDSYPQTIREHFLQLLKSKTSTILNLHLFPLIFRPLIVKGKTDNPGAIGYEAAESAFSPLRKLYSIPLLPQSALLNSLPLDNVLIGQIQAFLESFIQLINPTSKQQLAQMKDPQSRLWLNLQINAQRATGMFLYNQELLSPYLDTEENKLNTIRKEQHLQAMEELRQHLLQLIVVSQQSNILYSLRCMRNALNALHLIAYLQIPLKESSISNRVLLSDKNFFDVKRDQVIPELVKPLPKLLGRAIVRLTFERPGPIKFLLPSTKLNAQTISVVPVDGNTTMPEQPLERTFNSIEGIGDTVSDQNPFGDVRIVVDGINHPFAAGNFVDLCKKKFYQEIAVRKETIEYSATEIVNYTILGYSPNGYRDPLTDKLRRIPLEIYREDENRNRFILIGSAQNSAVFTNAIPVLSFATYGALGMFHDKGDGNGASTSFFWLKLNRLEKNINDIHNLKVIQRLNNRYSLFAYVIEGNDILDQLREDDMLVDAVVEDGAWKLIEPAITDEERVIPLQS